MLAKRYDDLGTINSVKLLPKINSYNGYIQLYTEIDSHIEEGDTIFITYSGETSNLNNDDIILDNYINILYSSDFIYDSFTQGYTVLYVNKNINTFVINRLLQTIPPGKKLYGHFVSKIVCNNITLPKGTIDSTLFKDGDINLGEVTDNIDWLQGIMLNGNIYSTDIKDKYDVGYLSLLLDYDDSTDTYTKYSNIDNNYKGYSYFFDLSSSIKNCIFNSGLFYNCAISSENVSGGTINNGYFENCLNVINYNIYGGYFKDTTLNVNCQWYNGYWDGGIFILPIWRNGVFLNGYFGDVGNRTSWENGNFYNGNWRGLTWNNGIFYGGLFEGTGSTENSGELVNAKWLDGSFNGGIMYRNTYNTISWDKGTVNGGKLINVVFNTGTINNGEFYNSSIKNCTINEGTFYGGNFSNYITSGISYNYIVNCNIYNGNFIGDIADNNYVAECNIYDGYFENCAFYNKNTFYDGTYLLSGFYCESTFNNGTYDNCTFTKSNVNESKASIRSKIVLSSGETSYEIVEKLYLIFDNNHLFTESDAGKPISFKGFNNQELYGSSEVARIIANNTYYDPSTYNNGTYLYISGVTEKSLIIENDIYKSWMFGDSGVILAITQNIGSGSMIFNDGIYKNSNFTGDGIIINGGNYKYVDMKNQIVFNNGTFNGNHFYSDVTGTTLECTWYNGNFYSGTFGKQLTSDTYTVVIKKDSTEIRTENTGYTSYTGDSYYFKIVDIYPLVLSQTEEQFDEEEPIAGFTILDPLYVNENIRFESTSSYAISYLWDFGDDGTSTLANPTHKYTATDSYTVTLTVSNPLGTDTYSETIDIINEPILPTASFTFDNFNPIFINDTISFVNTSINATGYTWDFGDGDTSTGETPSHSYSEDGTYKIILTADNLLGSNTYTSDVTIYPTPTLPPVAKFYWSPTLIHPGDDVSFFDDSENQPTSWLWAVKTTLHGVPSIIDTTQNIITSFTPLTTPYSYYITLTVTNSYGSDTTTKTITVYPISGGGGGIEIESWTPTHTDINGLDALYNDYNNNIFNQPLNLTNIPWVDSGITDAYSVSPFDVVVKIQCSGISMVINLIDYLENIEEINFIDPTRQITYSETTDPNVVNKYLYDNWNTLFSMNYRLVNYVQNELYIYLVIRFTDLYDLYMSSSDSEKSGYVKYFKNIWSIANTGYYTHPFPTVDFSNVDSVNKYYIRYVINGALRPPRSSDWLLGSCIPPWWFQNNTITFDKAENETVYSLRNYVDEAYDISLLRLGEPNPTSGTPPTNNLLTFITILNNLKTYIKNFDEYNNNYYVENSFENFMKYHIQNRNASATTSGYGAWLELIDVPDMIEYVQLENIPENKQLTTYGIPLYVQKLYYYNAYSVLFDYFDSEKLFELDEDGNSGIPDNWYYFLKNHNSDTSSWVQNFVKTNGGVNTINYSLLCKYYYNITDTIIFEAYHKYKKLGGYFSDYLRNMTTSDIASLYEKYYYSLTTTPPSQTVSTTNIFTDSDKTEFEHVNSWIQTNNVNFCYPAAIEIICKNPKIDYSEVWSGGTFYDGTFTGRWYGGKWSRGTWKGENYTSGYMTYATPTDTIGNNANYTVDYEALRKRKLYYDIPPWDDANENKNKKL